MILTYFLKKYICEHFVFQSYHNEATRKIHYRSSSMKLEVRTIM